MSYSVLRKNSIVVEMIPKSKFRTIDIVCIPPADEKGVAISIGVGVIDSPLVEVVSSCMKTKTFS